MTTLRAGLIGHGQMGRHHRRVLSSLAGVSLVGIADERSLDDPSLSGCMVASSVSELLEADLDLAVVATPTATHEQIALELAEAGVHTLVEKPVAPTAAAGTRMADAFRAAGLIGCVGHIERYNPALQSLRTRLADGHLGDIYQVATRRQGPFPERIADVGVVLDLATHDIDLTAWVTQREYVSVTARTAHRSGRQHEDLVAAVASLDDGTVVNHLINWLSPLKERATVVTGERGTFVADTLSADLTFFANGIEPVQWDNLRSFRGVVQGDVIRYAIPKPEPLRVELEAFRDAVLGLDDRTVSFADASRTVRVAEAVVSASHTGGIVDIARAHTA